MVLKTLSPVRVYCDAMYRQGTYFLLFFLLYHNKTVLNSHFFFLLSSFLDCAFIFVVAICLLILFVLYNQVSFFFRVCVCVTFVCMYVYLLHTNNQLHIHACIRKNQRNISYHWLLLAVVCDGMTKRFSSSFLVCIYKVLVQDQQKTTRTSKRYAKNKFMSILSWDHLQCWRK